MHPKCAKTSRVCASYAERLEHRYRPGDNTVGDFMIVHVITVTSDWGRGFQRRQNDGVPRFYEVRGCWLRKLSPSNGVS